MPTIQAPVTRVGVVGPNSDGAVFDWVFDQPFGQALEPSIFVSIVTPVTDVGVVGPEPGVIAAGTASVATPVTATVASTPEPAFQRAIQAPVTTVNATMPEPAFRISPQIPVTTVNATMPEPGVAATGTAPIAAPAADVLAAVPEPGVGYLQWLIAGTSVPESTEERASHRLLTLTFGVSTATLMNTLRPLKANEGQVDVLSTDSGGYTSVDRANGNNTFALVSPVTRDPLRLDGDYHVERYEEDLVSEAVEEWQVEVEFVPAANRSDTPSINETVGTGDWGFTTRYGTIATDRVDAEFIGTGTDGVERFEVIVRLTFAESHAFEAALALNEGVRVRPVPDETNEAIDDTAGNANTLTVDSPTNTVVADGDYVVTEFESTRLNDAFQQVTWTMAAAP